MGSSLILQGGAVSARSLRELITHPVPHDFTVGTVLRWDTATNRYVRALADSAANAEVAGVVSDVTSTFVFEITYSGIIQNIVDSTNAPVLFLSSTQSGQLVATPPSAIGTIVKPVLTRNTNLSGHLVMNYLGTQIGGSSTISVDEIQPVGTVMPFAGSVIPDTWLECNGASYAISDYSQLYERIRNTSGVRAPMYGHVFTATTSTVNYSSGQNVTTIQGALNANTAVYLRTRPITQTQDIVARILSVSGSGNAITITAQVIPTYNSTTKNFSVPNSFLKVGGTIGSVSDPNGILGIGTLGSNGLVGQEYATDAIVNSVNITHFNVPDLRGRFALGINSGNIADIDGDSTLNSAIGSYGIASMGGEESHTLTTGEMPSHTHGAGTLATGSTGSHRHIYTRYEGQIGSGMGGFDYDPDARDAEKFTQFAGEHTHPITGSVAAAGSNTPHNNMPPYLAVRYIIKAKPYTRAAIIDGIDIPYNSLLVRDLRTSSIGGSLSDLVICTNVSGDGGLGTERMRITGADGRVGIGKTPSSGISFDVRGWAAFESRVGIGNINPQVALDVTGQVRSSIPLADYLSASPKTLVTMEYLKNMLPQCVQTHYNGADVLVGPSNASQWNNVALLRANAVEITPLNTSITPRYNTSKILVTFNIAGEGAGDDSRGAAWLLYRVVGGVETIIGDGNGSIAGNRIFGHKIPQYDVDIGSTINHNIITYLDSPNTTQTVTYKLKYVCNFASFQNRQIFCLNRCWNNCYNANGVLPLSSSPNTIAYELSTSQCILQEFFS